MNETQDLIRALERLAVETGSLACLGCGREASCSVHGCAILRSAARALADEPLTLEFDVVDTTTGEYPDWERIAREESWAKGLVYCDMDGIAILEDGSLILLDECGNYVPCPPDRFEIRFLPGGGDGA